MLTMWCCTALALHPSRIYTQVPENLQLNYRQFFIRTPDSAKLNAWYFPPDTNTSNKHITVIVAGQDAGNMSSQLLLAEALQKAGLDVITFDYRGFGASSDFKMDSTYLYYSEFVTDLLSVMRYAKSKYTSNKLCIYARSMGSIITSLALQQERADYVIGDGYVSSLTDTKRRLQEFYKVPVRLPADSMRFANSISGINAKMLIFAGKQDWVTTVDDALKIVDRNYNRKLVLHPLGHLEAAKAFTKDVYADGLIHEVMAFFEAFKD